MRNFITVDFEGTKQRKKVVLRKDGEMYVEWDIKQSPEYTDDALLNRDYEASLYNHYHRKGYWLDELLTKGSVVSNETVF